MARTSSRRWKGCRLCKPHKDARNGDSWRMPRSAVRQFPTRNGKRVSRRDVGRWGDD